MPKPKKRTKKHPKRRNVVLLAAMLLGFVGLITTVNVLSIKQSLIFPEIHKEKEALRSDPSRNAYFDVAQATREYVPPPLSELVPTPDEPDNLMEYKPPSGSIPDLLGIKRTLDDEHTLAYIESSRNVIEYIETAAQKPRFVAPIVSWNPYVPLYIDTVYPYTAVRQYLAHVAVELQLNNNEERAYEMIDHIYSFLAMYSNSSYGLGGYSLLRIFHSCMHHIYRYIDDPGIRQRLVKHVTALPQPFNDFDQIARRKISNLDEIMIVPTVYNGNISIPIRWNLFKFTHSVNAVRDHLPEFLAMAQQPVYSTDYALQLEEFANATLWPEINEYVVESIITGFNEAHRANARHAAMPLIFALEECKIVNGIYPETLDELVPRFIDKLPVSQYTNGPYIYTKDRIPLGEEYRLIDEEMNYPYAIFSDEPFTEEYRSVLATLRSGRDI